MPTHFSIGLRAYSSLGVWQKCHWQIRKSFGDKIELAMEPALGKTVLIVEDKCDVVDLLALNLR